MNRLSKNNEKSIKLMSGMNEKCINLMSIFYATNKYSKASESVNFAFIGTMNI